MCLGIPGQIIEITNADALMAKVDVSGIRREVNIACVVDATHPAEQCVGDWVLVHVGFAMSRIDEQEAQRPSLCCSNWVRHSRNCRPCRTAPSPNYEF